MSRSLRELQTSLPWTVHYHRDFRASPMAHKDFAHALTHVMKAAGKLAALVNDAEHGGCEFKPEEVDPYVADLVVCALRMANTCPGRMIDLERAVVERIETKNKVRLPADEPPVRQEQTAMPPVPPEGAPGFEPPKGMQWGAPVRARLYGVHETVQGPYGRETVAMSVEAPSEVVPSPPSGSGEP